MTRKIKWAFRISIWLSLLGLGFSFWLYLNTPENFPIRAVEIHGDFDKTLHREIKSALNEELMRGFFSSDIGKVKQLLLDLPWVASVTVKRVWPDRLSVHLYEHSALARLTQTSAVSQAGTLFYPTQMKALSHLPLFEGPETRLTELVTHYQIAMTLLEPIHAQIAELRMAATGSIVIKLDNHLQLILGVSAFEERLSRFVRAYRKSLKPHADLLNYIDLRYTNGLALGWKPGVTKPLLGAPIR